MVGSRINPLAAFIRHLYTMCIYIYVDISPARLATKKVFGDGQEKRQETGRVREIFV